MDLKLLTLFFKVAKEKNFSTASETLGLERSSVSRGIAQLELSLGTQLFSRTTRNIALTSAGAAFLREIEPHMQALRGAVAGISEKAGPPSGLLRISAPVDMAVTFLAAALAGFAARYPAVRLDVRIENRKADVVLEAVDVALRVVLAPLPDSTLIAIRLSALRFHAYATPALLLHSGYPGSPEEAARLPWLTFRDGHLEGFPRPAGKPALVADDMRFLHQAGLAGMGIVMLPTFLAQADVTAGRLVAVLPELMTDVGELYSVHPPAMRLPRRVRVFCDYMIDHLKANPLTL
ncbi:Transcriptional regulator, LysR family [Janthinobacterium sp. CG23_2]|nr:Transcriptional regulator, LysR family [Janthinobacterium sp. CG23_2]CUU29316.1 Transcriptional regulator, LysR family [Janthinobacterium sp. CG23_2]